MKSLALALIVFAVGCSPPMAAADAGQNQPDHDAADVSTGPRRDADRDEVSLDVSAVEDAVVPADVRDASAVDALVSDATGGCSMRSLRFRGSGVGDIDRVKIRVDDPSNTRPGPPADVGAEDFTIEWWLRATSAANGAGAVRCGDNIDWIRGNIVIDRDRFSQDRKFGVSIAGGRVVFGVSGDRTGDRTLCGTRSVLDDRWHHVAVQRRRSDGFLWLFVDGQLEAQGDGPDGDVSYPDNGVPGNHCGGPCTNSDPFLVVAAEKHDAGREYPSFNGWIDELRLSRVLRYRAAFPVPIAPFAVDAETAALYHFDEGSGDDVVDSAANASPGVRRYGGTPPGPDWSMETPFVCR